MKGLFRDVRYASRFLLRQKGFTAVVIITFALGIGATSTVFTILNALLIRPLPYRDPDRIAIVWESWAQKGLNQIPVLNPDFLYWRENAAAFEVLAAFQNKDFNLTGRDDPERVSGARVSDGFFRTLGVGPSLGRSFQPEDDRTGNDRVVIISHRLWQRRFGSDPEILDTQITLNDESFTIIGVMPRDFRFSVQWSMAGLIFPNVELWVPLALSSAEMASRSGHDLTVVGRLKDGITIEQAQADMDRVVGGLQKEQPEFNSGIGASVIPLHSQLVGDVRPSLLVLSGAVALVLLIACANVANLLLSRAATRQKEVAIRAALGATHGRLVGHLLTETVLLALTGGGFGLVLAVWATGVFVAISPTELGRANAISVDMSVVGFTFCVSVLTGTVFGLAPSWQASSTNLSAMLKPGFGGGSSRPVRRKLRSILVVTQTAVLVVLLISTGLVVRSFIRLQSVDPGFDPDNISTAGLSLPASRYPQASQQARFFTNVLTEIESLPGTQAAALASNLPFEESWEILFTVEGQEPASVRETPVASSHAISPNYLNLMGIALVKGRSFTQQDTETSDKVVIVDENLAQRYWPGDNPINKRIRRGAWQSSTPWLTVVGVVKSVRQYGLDKDPKPEIYLPYQQNPRATMSVLLKSDISLPEHFATAIRQAVQTVDKNQPIYSVRTMRQIISDSTAPKRFSLVTFGVFALIALILASVGMYGVVSYYAAQRTQEMGLRMALGARPADILKLVVGHGLRLALAGIAVGVIASIAATRVLSSLLYGVRATDPAVFLGVTALLIGVALLASYVPARRASRTDPLLVIRYE